MVTTTAAAPDDAMASLSISTWFLSSQWALFIDNRLPNATLAEKVAELHQRVQHHYGSDSDKRLVVLDRFDFVLRSLPNLKSLVGDAGSNEAAYSYYQLAAAKLMNGAVVHEHTTLKLVDAALVDYLQITKVGANAEERIKLLLDHIERKSSLKGMAPRIGSEALSGSLVSGLSGPSSSTMGGAYTSDMVEELSTIVGSKEFIEHKEAILEEYKKKGDPMHSIKSIKEIVCHSEVAGRQRPSSLLILQAFFAKRKVPHGLDPLFPVLDLLRPHFPEYLTRFVAFGESMGEDTDLLRLKQCRLPEAVFKALEGGTSPDMVNNVISHINSCKFNVQIPRQTTDHIYSSLHNLTAMRVSSSRFVQAIGLKPEGQGALIVTLDTAIDLLLNSEALKYDTQIMLFHDMSDNIERIITMALDITFDGWHRAIFNVNPNAEFSRRCIAPEQTQLQDTIQEVNNVLVEFTQYKLVLPSLFGLSGGPDNSTADLNNGTHGKNIDKTWRDGDSAASLMLTAHMHHGTIVSCPFGQHALPRCIRITAPSSICYDYLIMTHDRAPSCPTSTKAHY